MIKNSLGKIGEYESGYYTPVVTNVSGVTVNGVSGGYYTRIGNIVTVVGRASLSFSDATDRVCSISLPIQRSSNFSNQNSGFGVATCNRGGGSYSNFAANIYSTNGAKTVTLETSSGKSDVDNNAHDVIFQFMYSLI